MSRTLWVLVGALLAGCHGVVEGTSGTVHGPGGPDGMPAPPTPLPAPASAPLTGAHFLGGADMSTGRGLGYGFAVQTLDPSLPDAWPSRLEAARVAGLKLVVQPWPTPFTPQADGSWNISAAGLELLQYLGAHPDNIFALYVFNEPYWQNIDGRPGDYTCGNLSADQLRRLRRDIQSVWPNVKIYHDMGMPSAWVPGGSLAQSYPCLTDTPKYADQTEIADYVGLFCYPFDDSGDHSTECLDRYRSESAFVVQSMKPARPILLGQAFRCPTCGEATAMPTFTQLHAFNCALRKLEVAAVSWYVWSAGQYAEELSAHPELWDATRPDGCETQ